MLNKIRIGILGTSNIAANSVIPNLLSLSDKFKIIGIGGRNFENTKLFCSRFELPAFDSYESVINSGEIDAVYIPLPNSLHFQWAMKSLELGLHVMCEKSLCCNLNEVNRLTNKAREKNLLLMEHFQFRFHRQFTVIKTLINEGTIGEIRCINSSFGLPPFNDLKNIRYFSDLGGGALLDAGAYTIKISQLIAKDKLKVLSSHLHTPPQYEVDIHGSSHLTNSNNNISIHTTFGFDHSYQNSLEIWGSKGRITTNRIFTAKPDYNVNIHLEKQEGYNLNEKIIKLSPDNHFKNIWNYFHKGVKDEHIRLYELKQNENQASLLTEIKLKASE